VEKLNIFGSWHPQPYFTYGRQSCYETEFCL